MCQSQQTTQRCQGFYDAEYRCPISRTTALLFACIMTIQALILRSRVLNNNDFLSAVMLIQSGQICTCLNNIIGLTAIHFIIYFI